MRKFIGCILFFITINSLIGATTVSVKGLVFPLREVTISSPVEAKIDAMPVREGDYVETGDLLVGLYSQLQVLEAERAEAAVMMREFEFKTSDNLFRDNVVSEDEALKSRIEWDLSKLTLAMANEQVEVRQLKAPFSGTVVERFKEVGEMAQTTEPILILVDLSEVYVQFYLPAHSINQVQLGNDVGIRFPALSLEKPRIGKIDYIDPRVDAASGLFRVRVKLPNPEGKIKAGIRAEVSLQN